MTTNPVDKASSTWTTQDEIEHLDNLGYYTTSRVFPENQAMRRKRLLLLAREAYEKRIVWGNIKTIIVKQHLKMLIKEAQ